MKKRMRNSKGFTLIELIVVIAILGILAAIAIPRLAGFRTSSALAADRSTAAVIAKAAEAYAAGEGWDEDQRLNFVDSGLVADALTSDEILALLGTEGLLNTTDIEPQTTGTNVDTAFTIAYNATNQVYVVTLEDNGTVIVQYPENLN